MKTPTQYKYDIHKQLCEDIHDVYVRKNQDYGNSFEKLYQKYGMESVIIRLSDKLNRLENLIRSDVQLVKDESINDTLLDLANYALLALVERKFESGDFDCFEMKTAQLSSIVDEDKDKKVHTCESNCKNCTECESKINKKAIDKKDTSTKADRVKDADMASLMDTIREYYNSPVKFDVEPKAKEEKKDKAKEDDSHYYSYSYSLDKDGNVCLNIDNNGEKQEIKDHIDNFEDLATLIKLLG